MKRIDSLKKDELVLAEISRLINEIESHTIVDKRHLSSIVSAQLHSIGCAKRKQLKKIFFNQLTK